MTIKVAINGYGRIGRNVLRAFYEGGKRHDIQIVATRRNIKGLQLHPGYELKLENAYKEA